MTRDIARSSTETPKDLWRTPQKLFSVLNEFFYFTVDAAANVENTLCKKYWSESDNALEKDWQDHIVFCNPPFSQLSKDDRWSSKFAGMEVGCVVLPVASDTKWFQGMMRYSDCHLFLFQGRVKYEHPDYKLGSPTFPSCLFLKFGANLRSIDFDHHMHKNGYAGQLLKCL